ncbi:COMM domain-containing protein 2-like [Topomyia yanbarensis]|uniref:COMM domain-containing protein 2-like n=1 Tax=Topomyia yanbarensis TaxID=2498891 RepID=UPI00273C74DC|nr:COMM domain-containing protein 2-like [Topomyia yanbarensis]XP_058823089.1 COMM domain-containing protein 2-like [Topomyia yanbarensis]
MAQLVKQEQDKHLKFVLDQPEQVLVEFCKLAIEYISSGINEKKCTIAAKKLETTFDTVKSCVEALVCLLIDSTKLHSSESDFQTLKSIDFTDGQIAILWQFVSSKRSLVENILKNSADGELHFRELEWRLEAKVASRALHKQATPVITMKLHLDSEVVNEHKEKLEQNDSSPTNKQNTRKEILLQTDPTSLVHLIQVLEQALIDSKTHRVRNFVKSFQK